MTEHNPPAFPTTNNVSGMTGLTMLDHFAGLAMQGLINVSFKDFVVAYKDNTDAISPIIAQASYETANAMLKEREKWIRSQ